jgi:aryl-alcohol dehydrogenase-like predicted oxidoreductase
MKYNFLSGTGMLVSELCLGTMTFGGKGYWEAIGQVSQQEADLLLKEALNSGINFIDTANVYSYGLSEEILGHALQSSGVSRNDLVIATKVRGRMGAGVNQVGLSRFHVMTSVEESLKRLGTQHIDLLYVHGLDPHTTEEQIMGTLNDLVRSGKVRYIGVCNWPAWRVMKANAVAHQQGWSCFSALQYYYSLATRDIENDILPMAADQQLAVFPWSPLAGGLLSGKYKRDQEKAGNSRRDSFDFPLVDKAKAFDIIDVLLEIGKARGVSAAQVALAWVRSQPLVTSTIIGARTLEQLKDNIASLDISFTGDETRKLLEISAVNAPYPNWMVSRQNRDRLPEQAP